MGTSGDDSRNNPLGLLSADMSWLQLLLTCVVGVVGLQRCTRAVSAVFLFVWRQYLRPAKPLASFGEWAVVTGATDGIGRAYCDVLAAAGMKIYLVSRNEEKLRETATALEHKYLIETKYFVADLVDAGAPTHDGSCWYGLKSNLEGLDVGVLINNAGMSHSPEWLQDIDAGAVAAIVSINCSAVVKMAQVVLPGMLSRKRGCIVNMSSGVAAVPAIPLLAVYAASKAFVNTFTAALAAECAPQGVCVQAQSPNFVSTKMSKMRASLTVPTPATWAAAARKHLGYEPHAFPYPPHALSSGILANVPRGLLTPMVLSTMQTMRAKSLKHKARSGKTE